jgi:hypothetical protein
MNSKLVEQLAEPEHDRWKVMGRSVAYMLGALATGWVVQLFV